MSGSKVNNYAIGASSIESVMLTLDKTFKGYHHLTVDTSVGGVGVCAGSVIEVNGALYKFDSDETIGSSKSATADSFIYIIPSGDTVTAEWRVSVPEWSDSMQGWYGTLAQGLSGCRAVYVEGINTLYFPQYLRVKEDYKALYKGSSQLLGVTSGLGWHTFPLSTTLNAGEVLRNMSILTPEVRLNYKYETKFLIVSLSIVSNIAAALRSGIGLNSVVTYESTGTSDTTSGAIVSAIIPASSLYEASDGITFHVQQGSGSTLNLYATIQVTAI